MVIERYRQNKVEELKENKIKMTQIYRENRLGIKYRIWKKEKRKELTIYF